MRDEFPQDADGDALRRVVSLGNDLSLPMDVDFPVVFSDEFSARRFMELARQHGFATKLRKHDDDADWDVTCTRRMILTYDVVISIQDELNDLSSSLGGYSDGWGTFGN